MNERRPTKEKIKAGKPSRIAAMAAATEEAAKLAIPTVHRLDALLETIRPSHSRCEDKDEVVEVYASLRQQMKDVLDAMEYGLAVLEPIARPTPEAKARAEFESRLGNRTTVAPSLLPGFGKVLSRKRLADLRHRLLRKEFLREPGLS